MPAVSSDPRHPLADRVLLYPKALWFGFLSAYGDCAVGILPWRLFFGAWRCHASNLFRIMKDVANERD